MLFWIEGSQLTGSLFGQEPLIIVAARDVQSDSRPWRIAEYIWEANGKIHCL